MKLFLSFALLDTGALPLPRPSSAKIPVAEYKQHCPGCGKTEVSPEFVQTLLARIYARACERVRVEDVVETREQLHPYTAGILQNAVECENWTTLGEDRKRKPRRTVWAPISKEFFSPVVVLGVFDWMSSVVSSPEQVTILSHEAPIPPIPARSSSEKHSITQMWQHAKTELRLQTDFAREVLSSELGLRFALVL